jgi:ECF transporter S component (folate family)
MLKSVTSKPFHSSALQKLVIKALFIALHVALCSLSVNLGNMVVSFSGLPVILAGLFFGPLGGAEVGFLGSFINQVIKYGITPTTILWTLPALSLGFLVGLYTKYHHFHLNRYQLTGIILFSSLLGTVLNTFSMYVDSKLFHYYSYAYVFGALLFRFLSAIIRSLIYVSVVYPIVKRLNHFQHYVTLE